MPDRLLFHEPAQLPALEVNGKIRVLGCLPSPERTPFRMMAAYKAPLDPSLYREIVLADWDPPHVSNQGDKSSCTGHGSRCAFETAWIQGGFKKPAANFSGTYVYSWINGGQDQGAVISDACSALQMYGICTEAEAPENLVFHQQFSPNADKVAALCKPQVIGKLQTYDQILAALALGDPVVFGIIVGQNFSDLASDGMAPLPDTVAGGHCLCALGLKNHPKYGWVPLVQNSWDIDWGARGRCYLRREHFASRVDAYAIVSDKAPADVDVPPAQ